MSLRLIPAARMQQLVRNQQERLQQLNSARQQIMQHQVQWTGGAQAHVTAEDKDPEVGEARTMREGLHFIAMWGELHDPQHSGSIWVHGHGATVWHGCTCPQTRTTVGSPAGLMLLSMSSRCALG